MKSLSIPLATLTIMPIMLSTLLLSTARSLAQEPFTDAPSIQELDQPNATSSSSVEGLEGRDAQSDYDLLLPADTGTTGSDSAQPGYNPITEPIRVESTKQMTPIYISPNRESGPAQPSDQILLRVPSGR
jgi:hypothetical protein